MSSAVKTSDLGSERNSRRAIGSLLHGILRTRLRRGDDRYPILEGGVISSGSIRRSRYVLAAATEMSPCLVHNGISCLMKVALSGSFYSIIRR